MDTNRARLAARLLELVASGEMNPAEALEKWPDIETEPDTLLSDSWHDLSHFAADEDIRAKDQRYARYQTDVLLRRLREIRNKYELA